MKDIQQLIKRNSQEGRYGIGQILHCHVIKDRKKTYRLKGGTPGTWKAYLETIRSEL